MEPAKRIANIRLTIVTESGRNSIVICNLADEYKKRVVFLGIYYKIYLY